MKTIFSRFIVLMFGILMAASVAVAQESPATNQQEPATADEKQEDKALTIKDIMKQAHTDGLTKKVATGKASAEEKKSLQKLYEALTKLKPPKGDTKSWKTKTDALVAAAKSAVAGEKNADKKLRAATKCTDCHKVHKPPAATANSN